MGNGADADARPFTALFPPYADVSGKARLPVLSPARRAARRQRPGPPPSSRFPPDAACG